MIRFVPSPDGTKIRIRAPFEKKEDVKSIQGRTWNPNARVWEVPLENFELALKVFPDADVDPEVRAQAEEMKAKRQKAIEVKNMDDIKLTVPGLKGELYPYQAVGKAFLSLLEKREGAILAFDMGLGKTLTSIAEFLDLYNNGKATNCLIVAPASLKYSAWEKEIKKWTDLPYMIIEGSPIDPADREIIVEEGEMDWVRDAEGKRTYDMTPTYGKIETHTYPDVIELAPFLTADKEVDWALLQERYVLGFDLGKDSVIEPIIQESRILEGVRFRKFTGEKKSFRKEPTGRRVEVVKRVTGRALREVQYQQTDRPFMVMNYELFLSDTDIMPVIDHNWVVILDECHRIKNRRAETTKRLLKHCRNAGRKFLLSGTPLENRLEELYAVVDFAREGLLGAWYKFRQRYLIEDYWGSPIAPNPNTFNELMDKIAPLIMRRKKHEVLPDLPPLVEQEYWVDMNATQKELYDQISSGIIERMDSIEAGEEEFSYLDVLAQLTRLQQVLDSPALVSEVFGKELPEDSAKLDELSNILDDINIKENKVIVFSQYRNMTDILNARLTERYGKKAVRYIHGGVNNQLRGIYQNEFQENDEVRVMVLTTAGNYGLDLFEASYVICFDQLFNPQKMNQIVARAHRNGNRTGVVAIHMVTRNSYEERKLKILEGKKELFGAVIDGDAQLLEKLTLQDIRNML